MIANKVCACVACGEMVAERRKHDDIEVVVMMVVQPKWVYVLQQNLPEETGKASPLHESECNTSNAFARASNCQLSFLLLLHSWSTRADVAQCENETWNVDGQQFADKSNRGWTTTSRLMMERADMSRAFWLRSGHFSFHLSTESMPLATHTHSLVLISCGDKKFVRQTKIVFLQALWEPNTNSSHQNRPRLRMSAVESQSACECVQVCCTPTRQCAGRLSVCGRSRCAGKFKNLFNDYKTWHTRVCLRVQFIWSTWFCVLIYQSINRLIDWMVQKCLPKRRRHRWRRWQRSKPITKPFNQKGTASIFSFDQLRCVYVKL